MMLKILLFFVLFNIYLVYPFSSSDYGPFDLTLKKSIICHGPKKKDCAETTAKIVNETTLQYDVIVKENITNIRGSIYAVSSDTKQTVKLQFRTFCNHPFWQPLIEKLYNFKNCYILEGNYRSIMNAQELARNYYGGSFIYGSWTFKAILYNNNCNFVCTVVDLSLTQKKSRP